MELSLDYGLARQLNAFGHFRWWRADAAVPFAVAKIEDQSYHKPNKQPHPIRPAETINHRATNDDAERGNNRHRRYPKRAFQVGTRGAQDPNSGANKHECKQRPNTGHFAYDVLWNECAEDAGEQKEKNVRLVRGSKFRVHVGKGFRDKPVATHRIENARLAKQHHENYG